MRKTLLLFFTFLFLGNAYGQYEPMAVEGAHWVIFDKDDDSTYHHTIVVKGDTTVNGTDYKKIYRWAIQNDAELLQDFLPPYYLMLRRAYG